MREAALQLLRRHRPRAGALGQGDAQALLCRRRSSVAARARCPGAPLPGDHVAGEQASAARPGLAPAAGRRVQRPQPALDSSVAGSREVEPALVALELVGVDDAGFRLGHRRQRPPAMPATTSGSISAASAASRSCSSEAVGRRADRQRTASRRPARCPGPPPSEDADAGLLVAGQDRALDRGGAPPARQQRGMQVDAAEPRCGQHRARQQQPVGADHGEVGVQSRELGLGVGVLAACAACERAAPAARPPRARACAAAGGRARRAAAAGCRPRRPRGRRRAAPRGWAARRPWCP